MIPIMSIETAATASEQIPGNSSRTATTAARPLERVFNADQKDTHWGKRKLARDR